MVRYGSAGSAASCSAGNPFGNYFTATRGRFPEDRRGGVSDLADVRQPTGAGDPLRRFVWPTPAGCFSRVRITRAAIFEHVFRDIFEREERAILGYRRRPEAVDIGPDVPGGGAV